MRLAALGAVAALRGAPSACGFPDAAASGLAEAFSLSRSAGPLHRPPREQRAGLPSEAGPTAGGDRSREKHSVALLEASAGHEASGTAASPILARPELVLAVALVVGILLTVGITFAIRLMHPDFCGGHRGRNPHRDASALGGNSYGALKRPTSHRAGAAVKKVVSWADLRDGCLAEMDSERQLNRQQATAACASA
jgi:hypothetical protein